MVEQIFCHLHFLDVQSITPFSYLFPSLSFPKWSAKMGSHCSLGKALFFFSNTGCKHLFFTDWISYFAHHFTSLAYSKKELSLIMKIAIQYVLKEGAIVLESFLGPSPHIKDASMKDTFCSVAYGVLLFKCSFQK